MAGRVTQDQDRLPSGRVNCSRRVYNTTENIEVDINNQRTQHALRNLSVSFNLNVVQIQNDARKQDEAIEESIEKNGKNETATETGNVRRNFALFVKDQVQEIIKSSYINKAEVLKKRIKDMYILDALEYFTDENNKMPLHICRMLLRDIVSDLQDNILKTYDQAWNHPDEKFCKFCLIGTGLFKSS